MIWNIDLVEYGYFVKITCAGVFSVEDCLLMTNELIYSPYWRPGMRMVVDYRRVTFNNVQLDELLMIRDFHSSIDGRMGHSKLVFLMDAHESYDLGLKYEMLAERKVSAEMHVFFTESDAMLWLQSLPGGHFIN